MDKEVIEKIKSGDIKTLSKTITALENDTYNILELLPYAEIDYPAVIGITGPPGSGKSTLLGKIIDKIDKKTALLLIDPTSRVSGGSILGDRLRIKETEKGNVFIRSFSSGNHLGGISVVIPAVCKLLAHAGFDLIFIETVGIGQMEDEICDFADKTIMIVQPLSGDEIQGMKAGILERVDTIIVNKSDLKDFYISYTALKRLFSDGIIENEKTLLSASALNNDGIDEAADIIIKYCDEKHIGINEKRKQFEFELYLRELTKNILKNKIKKEEVSEKIKHGAEPLEIAKKYIEKIFRKDIKKS